ncbi:MAG: OmpH family outer membrane protein [Rikenellaceae bacterium]
MKRVFIACATFALFMNVACTTNAPQATSTDSTTEQSSVVATSTSDIAYVDVEYALSQSEIFKTEGVALQQKTEKAQTSLSSREQKLQSDAAALQDKYQRGLITTANAQAEQEKIQQRAVSFQTSAQKELQQLEEENTVFSNRINDLVRRAVDQINSDKKYKMIINASALIDADTTLNITTRVIEVVDELYAADKATEKK